MADFGVFYQEDELFNLQFERQAADLRVAMPGIIEFFDPATQTARVRPAMKRKAVISKREVRQIDYPIIHNVPVVLPFAQGAGLLLTVPISEGDECLLIFADRPLGNFIQCGGIQVMGDQALDPKCTVRMHHLTDAICIPGIISNPQAVPEYSTRAIELRDRERKSYLSLGPEGIVITDGSATWNMKDGKVTLDAPSGISYSTPANMDVRARNMDLGDSNRVSGSLVSTGGSFTDKHGVTLNSHRHNHGSEPDKIG